MADWTHRIPYFLLFFALGTLLEGILIAAAVLILIDKPTPRYIVHVSHNYLIP